MKTSVSNKKKIKPDSIIETNWEIEDVRHEVWGQGKGTFWCGVTLLLI